MRRALKGDKLFNTYYYKSRKSKPSRFSDRKIYHKYKINKYSYMLADGIATRIVIARVTLFSHHSLVVE